MSKINALAALTSAIPLIESMTYSEIKSICKIIKIPVGRNKQVAGDNLLKAVSEGKASIKMVGHIFSAPNAKGHTSILYMKTLKTMGACEIDMADTKDQLLKN